MDKIGIIVLILFSAAIVFFGNKHWNETIAKEAVSEASVSGNTEEVKLASVEEVSSELDFAGNWSEQARNDLKSKQAKGIPFMIYGVGKQENDDYSIFEQTVSHSRQRLLRRLSTHRTPFAREWRMGIM